MAVVRDYLERNIPGIQTTEIGIGGFTAVVRVREKYTLLAEVPDTPVEDGSFVHDHIILKPITLSIEGDVSDVHLRASPITRKFERVQAEIGNLTAQYAPARTVSQLEKVGVLFNNVSDAINRIDNFIDTGSQALDYFGNKDTASKGLQEQFLDAMESLHNGKQAFTIDMPYRSHQNMVIISLVTETDNETAVTTFTLEAKQIQYAEVIFADISTPAPGLDDQTKQQIEKGTQEGAAVVESLATQIKSSIGDLF